MVASPGPRRSISAKWCSIRRPGFHRVADDTSPLLAILNLLAEPAQAALSLSDNTWKGKVKDFDVTIGLTPSNGNLHLDVDANKSIAGGTIDVHGSGQLNGFTNEGSITLADGSTTEVTFNNQGLNGKVDFDWKVAFDADHGGNDEKLKESAVANLPFSLDFPMLLGPIPFKLSFKTGFAFQPTFSSKVAVAQGSYHVSFGGSMPMTDTAGAGSASPAADERRLRHPRRRRKAGMERSRAAVRSIPTAAHSPLPHSVCRPP